MDEANLVTSVDLWTSAKVIGRECSQVNLDYLWCKKDNGNKPDLCAKQGVLVTACVNNVVKVSKEKFAAEFKAHHDCLDFNDYRTNECQETEKKFHACWNKLNGVEGF